MKIITAIDSFKGSLTSAEANSAAARAILRLNSNSNVKSILVSDGGEGWIEACSRIFEGKKMKVSVADPLGRQVCASYLLSGDLAVMEVAQACGLNCLSAHERNPLLADSRGVGQMILHALKKGARRFVVGLGGSATCDAGYGMLQVLADALVPSAGIMALSSIRNLSFTIASDVQNPLLGDMGAARVFAPQKGATPQMVEELEQRISCFVQQTSAAMGYDCSQKAGAGAAGGLGYAFMQFLHATYVSGADWLLERSGLDQELQHASLVLTGEGAADAQTLMGKLPFCVMQRAKDRKVPTLLLAGKVQHRPQLLQAGFSDVLCINPSEEDVSISCCPELASARLEETVFEYLSVCPFWFG